MDEGEVAIEKAIEFGIITEKDTGEYMLTGDFLSTLEDLFVKIMYTISVDEDFRRYYDSFSPEEELSYLSVWSIFHHCGSHLKKEEVESLARVVYPFLKKMIVSVLERFSRFKNGD